MSLVTRAGGRGAPFVLINKERLRRGSGWIALLVVWVVWGSTYSAIKVAVEDLPPVLMAGMRYVAGGVIMFPLAVRAGRPTRAQWLGCAVIGTLLLGSQGALAYAERTVPSGYASLLIATVPLWLLSLDAGLNRTKVGLAQLAGLVVGLAGVALLSGVRSGSVSAVGAVLCLCVAASWALGTILARRVSLPSNPVLGSSMQMLTAGPLLVAFAAATGELGAFHPAAVSARSWLALVYLTFVGTIVGLSAYMIAVRKLPTSTVSTYAYVNPVIAVLIGTTLLNERLTPAMLGGGALIVAAVVLVVRKRPATASPAESDEA
jgi:drug/metabolite transporter (DMT)-like permease